MTDNIACENTDREIWRGPDEGDGDAYADSLHITSDGGLGINCGGSVQVKPIREWHRLADEVRRLREVLRHADIDLSVLLTEIADRDMAKSVRKTLDMMDEARSHKLPGHDETMAALNSLTIRK